MSRWMPSVALSDAAGTEVWRLVARMTRSLVSESSPVTRMRTRTARSSTGSSSAASRRTLKTVYEVCNPLTTWTSSNAYVLPTADAREQTTVTPLLSHQNSGPEGSVSDSLISRLTSTSPW